MELAVNIAVWLCIISGCFFSVVGGIGLLRFPDLFTRLHAASITDSLGAGLIFLGLIIDSGLSLVSVKLAMIMTMLLLTSPTTAHAIANAARLSGLHPKTQDETSS